MKSLCVFFLLAVSSALSAQTYTVLHNFGKGPGDPGGPSQPGTIAQGRGGTMVTTSPHTEADRVGAAFRIWTGGTLQVLHRFGTANSTGGLTLATDGKFYGTLENGGQRGLGTIFKMSEDGVVTNLYEFQGGSDGEYPEAAPIQSVEGDFYGTSVGLASPRRPKYGSVYRITKYGAFTLLHAFTNSDGANPVGPLIQGTDFYFYGVTMNGGSQDLGVVYRVNSSGDFKVLVNFDGSNGSIPYSGLVEANDGNFYGATYGGGPSDAGVLFRMTPNGTVTVLHSFTYGSDGGNAVGQLVQATDGNLYGTNTFGGKNGYGVLFRASLAGDVVPLYNFALTGGINPQSPLLQQTSGKLYGTTYQGGKFDQGVFFRFDTGLPPFVTYLPTYGRAGALVQVLGQDFTEASQVFFNGTPASFTLVYSTYLRATVPEGATTGPITVTTANGTLTSNKVFPVHP